MKKNTAIIFGAGPGGLTTAYELLKNTDITPIIIEKESTPGGLCRNIPYKGNIIDLGGHRFYSQHIRVLNWWKSFFPFFENSLGDLTNKKNIMLIKKTSTSIYFNGKLFNYPIKPDFKTINNLGLIKSIRIFLSYLKSKLKPIIPEKSIEDFFINNFGEYLYLLFFKNYTKKVWGNSCREILPEWGSERINKVSIKKTLFHNFKQLMSAKETFQYEYLKNGSWFLYPKYGPGQFWEYIADQIIALGGKIYYQHVPIEIKTLKDSISHIKIKNLNTSTEIELSGNYYFSSIPIKNLIDIFPNNYVPDNVQNISDNLKYRDYIIVALLLKKKGLKTNHLYKPLNEKWIYIHEDSLRLGRIQIFNNWSSSLVKNQDNLWIGLEYFCSEGDELWNKSDKNMIDFAINELELIQFINKANVLDGTVIRMQKNYPIYSSGYKEFGTIIKFFNSIPNLYLIGRNGMHKYFNIDHAMLSAFNAVDIILNKRDKNSIWDIDFF